MAGPKSTQKMLILRKNINVLRTCVDNLFLTLKLYVRKSILDGGNLGTFYKYSNKKLIYRTLIPTLLANDDVLVDEDDKVAIFNDYFCSTCLEDDSVTPQLPDAVPVGIEFYNIEFNANEIRATS